MTGLSEFKIRKAKKRDRPYKLSDGGGLFLLVKPNGSKLWQQKYRFADKERLLSHGPYPDVSLAKARRKRDQARELIADGKDPGVQKKLDQIAAERSARMTFKLVAEEYIDGLVARELATATIRKQRWYLLDLAKPLHKRPISEVTPAEVLYLLKSIEKSGRRETARKMRTAMSAVFRLAVVTMRAETDPTVALKGALVPPKVVGRAAITDEKQFGALLRSFEDFSGWPVIVDAMKF